MNATPRLPLAPLLTLCVWLFLAGFPALNAQEEESENKPTTTETQPESPDPSVPAEPDAPETNEPADADTGKAEEEAVEPEVEQVTPPAIAEKRDDSLTFPFTVTAEPAAFVWHRIPLGDQATEVSVTLQITDLKKHGKSKPSCGIRITNLDESQQRFLRLNAEDGKTLEAVLTVTGGENRDLTLPAPIKAGEPIQLGIRWDKEKAFLLVNGQTVGEAPLDFEPGIFSIFAATADVTASNVITQ